MVKELERSDVAKGRTLHHMAGHPCILPLTGTSAERRWSANASPGRTLFIAATMAITVLLAAVGVTAESVVSVARVVSGPLGMSLTLASAALLALIAVAGQRRSADEVRFSLHFISILATELTLLIVIVRFFYIR